MGLLEPVAAFWPAAAWPATFALCSGGFGNIVYAFGFGYGASMVATSTMTAALAKYHHKTPLTPFGIACCGLYAAYGVRLSTYVLRRQGEDSYLPKLEALQLKSDMMGVAGKFAIVAGVSFSQALYALPLTVAMSPSAARARPALRALGWAGVGISAVGLLIEHVADEQKLAGKREKPGAPVVDGLYSYCRHPNYFGELLFHCGISCMGVSGTPMQVFACVFPTFFMGFTLQNAAVRSDKEADHRYKNIPGYAQWASSTPPLLPRPAGAATPPPPTVAGRAS